MTPETKMALLEQKLIGLTDRLEKAEEKISGLVGWQKFVLGGAAAVGLIFGIFAAQIKQVFGIK